MDKTEDILQDINVRDINGKLQASVEFKTNFINSYIMLSFLDSKNLKANYFPGKLSVPINDNISGFLNDLLSEKLYGCSVQNGLRIKKEQFATPSIDFYSFSGNYKNYFIDGFSIVQYWSVHQSDFNLHKNSCLLIVQCDAAKKDITDLINNLKYELVEESNKKNMTLPTLPKLMTLNIMHNLPGHENDEPRFKK